MYTLGIALPLLLGVSAYSADSLTFSQPEIPLWSGSVPGSEGVAAAPEKWNPSTNGFHRVTNINKPSVTVFLPPKDQANGTAVLICPGGAHRYLVMDLEGSLVAERLNAMGIAAFVLKSRLAHAESSTWGLWASQREEKSGLWQRLDSARRRQMQAMPSISSNRCRISPWSATLDLSRIV